MQAVIQLGKIVAENIEVGPVRFVGDWNGDDRPAGFAEYADAARHIRRRGNQEPGLTRERMHQRFGKDHILISVAGFALEKHAAGSQPLLRKEETRRVRFRESGKIPGQLTATTTE